MSILVINCGSSSIKFALYSIGESAQLHSTASGLIDGIGTSSGRFQAKGELGEIKEVLEHPTHLSGVAALHHWLSGHGVSTDKIVGIGHRIVQGGGHFSKSVVIDEEALRWIDSYSPIAPLHNPAHLLGIQKAMEAWPKVPQVAVFDTAFHQTMPPRAYRYAIPEELYKEHGIRRYGFHGTSHRFVTRRAAEMIGRPIEELALISAHLGNGCSASAVLGGICLDTTMGLTPLEGLVMGTRSGNLDPTIFGFVERKLGWSTSQTLEVLNKKSGLLGVSGISQDMRELLKAREAGDEKAALAIEIFVYQLAKTIGALTIPLGRLDALIFTGGIGENAAPVRAEVGALLRSLKISIDPEKNFKAVRGEGSVISCKEEGAPLVLVVPTDEELLIAKDTLALVKPE